MGLYPRPAVMGILLIVYTRGENNSYYFCEIHSVPTERKSLLGAIRLLILILQTVAVL